MNNIEIWNDIPNYEGLYQVSNFGNIKSLSNKRNKKEKLLKPGISSVGYFLVGLSKKCKIKSYKVHQLVAMTFLNHTPCGYKLVINHKDFNKLNNNIDNLEIVTQRENTNKKHFKSSSVYTGVSWNKKSKKWMAQISIKGKIKYLGCFCNELEAYECYNRSLKSLQDKNILERTVRVKSSLFKGVYYNNKTNKWFSSVYENKKNKYLGSFETEIEAREAYIKYKEMALF